MLGFRYKGSVIIMILIVCLRLIVWLVVFLRFLMILINWIEREKVNWLELFYLIESFKYGSKKYYIVISSCCCKCCKWKIDFLSVCWFWCGISKGIWVYGE